MDGGEGVWMLLASGGAGKEGACHVTLPLLWCYVGTYLRV